MPWCGGERAKTEKCEKPGSACIYCNEEEIGNGPEVSIFNHLMKYEDLTLDQGVLIWN